MAQAQIDRRYTRLRCGDSVAQLRSHFTWSRCVHRPKPRLGGFDPPDKDGLTTAAPGDPDDLEWITHRESGPRREGDQHGTFHPKRMCVGDHRCCARARDELLAALVVEQSSDGRADGSTVPERSVRVHRSVDLAPVRASRGPPEQLRRAGPIPSIPSVASCEACRQIVRLEPSVRDQRLRKVQGHLGVVGPANRPSARLADASPYQALKRPTFKGSTQCITQSETQEAPRKADRIRHPGGERYCELCRLSRSEIPGFRRVPETPRITA